MPGQRTSKNRAGTSSTPASRSIAKGRDLPFTMNVIHMAPGRLNGSLVSFAQISTRDYRSLRRVGLDMSFADLDADILHWVEREPEQAIQPSIIDAQRRAVWLHFTMRMLRNTSAHKLKYSRIMDHLEEVSLYIHCLEFPESQRQRPVSEQYGVRAIEGRDSIARALKGIITSRKIISTWGFLGTRAGMFRANFMTGDGGTTRWFHNPLVGVACYFPMQLHRKGTECFEPMDATGESMARRSSFEYEISRIDMLTMQESRCRLKHGCLCTQCRSRHASCIADLTFVI